MTTHKHGPQVQVTVRFERHVAAEDMRTGDYCRVQPDGRVKLLRDGDGYQVGDIAPIQDLAAGQSGQFVRVG